MTVLVRMAQLATTNLRVAFCVTVPLGMKVFVVKVRILYIVTHIVTNQQLVRLHKQPF